MNDDHQVIAIASSLAVVALDPAIPIFEDVAVRVGAGAAFLAAVIALGVTPGISGRIGEQVAAGYHLEISTGVQIRVLLASRFSLQGRQLPSRLGALTCGLARRAAFSLVLASAWVVSASATCCSAA